MTKDKSFCLGILCHKKFRINTCNTCGISICKICSMIAKNGEIYCPDCYLDIKVKQWSPDWDRLNTEFEEMLDSFKTKKNPVSLVNTSQGKKGEVQRC